MHGRRDAHGGSAVHPLHHRGPATPLQRLRQAVQVLADVEAEVALVGPVRNEHRWTWADQGGLQGALDPSALVEPTRRVSGVHPHRDSRACTSQIPSSSAGPFSGTGSRRPSASYDSAPPPPAADGWVHSTWSCRSTPLSRCRRKTSTRAVAGVTTTSPLPTAMPGTTTVARDCPSAPDTTTGAPPLSTPSVRRSRSSAVLPAHLLHPRLQRQGGLELGQPHQVVVPALRRSSDRTCSGSARGSQMPGLVKRSRASARTSSYSSRR